MTVTNMRRRHYDFVKLNGERSRSRVSARNKVKCAAPGNYLDVVMTSAKNLLRPLYEIAT